jgi:hypothetical protein
MARSGWLFVIDGKFTNGQNLGGQKLEAIQQRTDEIGEKLPELKTKLGLM